MPRFPSGRKWDAYIYSVDLDAVTAACFTDTKHMCSKDGYSAGTRGGGCETSALS